MASATTTSSTAVLATMGTHPWPMPAFDDLNLEGAEGSDVVYGEEGDEHHRRGFL